MSIKQSLRRTKLLYPLLSALRWRGGRLLMRLFHATGRRERAVLFSSYVGREYSDNPRRISEALHALSPETRILWQFAGGVKPEGAPDYIEVVPARSLRSLWAYSTVEAFVDNFNRPHYMLKFPDQTYVQTWHGDRGFKRIMKDMGTGEPFPDGDQMDLAVSGSRFGSGVYRSAFGYRGEILEAGCPRNDVLLENPPEVAERVRKALGLDARQKVLLYAPTFRDATEGRPQAAEFSLRQVRDALERLTDEKWVCLTRGHEKNRGVEADEGIDVSAWPEVSELLLFCDMLITDYSSIGGDFMLLGRPVIYFQPDRGDYDKERGLYFDPDASPLRVAHSHEELIERLPEWLNGRENCREALAFFGTCETGHAATEAAKRLLELMEARRQRR